MKPYFEYVKGINFTKNTRHRLATYVMSNLTLFNRSSAKLSKTGSYDWNWFLYQEHIPFDIMDEVGKRFRIPVKYEILGQTPFTNGRIHIDRIVPNVPPRISLINFPIYPLDNKDFGATNFYKLIKGNLTDYDNCVFEKQCQVDYNKNLPIIFNLQEYHNAENLKDDYRFNAQFTTDLPFDEVVSLYNSKKLFN